MLVASSGSSGHDGGEPGDDGGVAAGDGGVTGTDSGGDDGGATRTDAAGDDGATSAADLQRGAITLQQVSMDSPVTMQQVFSYRISANFASATVAAAQHAAVAITTVGPCTATVVPVSADAGPAQPPVGLNAGAITVTGIGMPPSEVLVYGSGGDAAASGYTGAKGDTQFYSDGDVISVRGAGGPDLPAFGAQTLAAPSPILLMAPVCSLGTCDSIDRTKDMLVQWTGGGAGRVLVTLESVASTEVVLVQCKFDVTAGTGSVPSSLLAKLDKAGTTDVTGIEQISPIDEANFLVGTAPTTFQIQSLDVESILDVSN